MYRVAASWVWVELSQAKFDSELSRVEAVRHESNWLEQRKLMHAQKGLENQKKLYEYQISNNYIQLHHSSSHPHCLLLHELKWHQYCVQCMPIDHSPPAGQVIDYGVLIVGESVWDLEIANYIPKLWSVVQRRRPPRMGQLRQVLEVCLKQFWIW